MSKETRDIYDRFNGKEKETELLLIVLDQRFFCARWRFDHERVTNISLRFVYVMFIERIYEEDIGFRVDIEFAQNLNLYAKKNIYIYVRNIRSVVEQGGSLFKLLFG